MKKIILLSFCITLILSGCGASDIERAQARAVDIGESYLDYEITAQEAAEQLDSILVPETEGNGQTYLEADITALSFAITRRDSTYEEVEVKVEYIKGRDYTD